MQPQQRSARSDSTDATDDVAFRPGLGSDLHRDGHFGQRIGLSAIAALTAGWFTMSWRMQGKPLLDATGETVGAVSVVLLGVAVIGTIRRSRR